MTDDRSTGNGSLWRKGILLVYPFFLAYYPVFALRNHNITYVDLSTVLRTLILVTLATAIIGAIVYLFTRNLEKSSIITSLIVLFFLTYGHLYLQLSDNLGNPVRHSYLAGTGMLVLLLVTILVLKSAKAARVISQFLAAVSIVLLGLVLFESLRYDIGEYRKYGSTFSKHGRQYYRRWYSNTCFRPAEENTETVGVT